jgi:polyhydroxyalkanoate synthesis regulator phasin
MPPKLPTMPTMPTMPALPTMPSMPSIPNLPGIPSMPQPADWRRVIDTGVQFTELRRSQARAIVADLVAQGHVARDQMGAAVEEVLDLSRRRSEDLRRGVRKVVRKEVQRQLSSLGLATKSDLKALERRLDRAGRETRKLVSKGSGSGKTGAKQKSSKKKSSEKSGSDKAPKSASKAG